MTKTTAPAPVPVEKGENKLAHPATLEWPFGSMDRWVEDLDRMFENLGWGRGFSPSFIRKEVRELSWMPAVEVLAKSGEFVVRAELPGLSKDDINVEVEEDALIIRGERKHEKEEKDEHFYRSERSYGSFSRVVPLPEGAKTDSVKASFKNGVLEITMPAPAAPEKRARRVVIESPPLETGKAA
jgi:HSP20 family protein